MKVESTLVDFLIRHPRIRDISFKTCLLEFKRAIIIELSIANAEGFKIYGNYKIITHSELLSNENVLIDALEAMAKELEDAWPWPQLDESDD